MANKVASKRSAKAAAPKTQALKMRSAETRGAKTRGAKTRGAKTRGAKTRVRILSACRQLFNERGLSNVTTADIANAVGINEGNLYYHLAQGAAHREFVRRIRNEPSAGCRCASDLWRRFQPL